LVCGDMDPEQEVNLLELVGEFNDLEIRYLIIGRRAVILYGGPVLTGDSDIWIHSADKKRTLSLLKEKLGFELSHTVDTRRPIVTAFSGMKKYDLFFHKGTSTIENEQIFFDECYRNSVKVEDPKGKIYFRVPSVDDLIRLKKIRSPNIRDEQDIEYLLKIKQLQKNR
jgi:hypothetical protein